MMPLSKGQARAFGARVHRWPQIGAENCGESSTWLGTNQTLGSEPVEPGLLALV